ncbi:hypothetical protein P3W24_03895 [Luteibacter sp. PPL201]|uniref:DUF539 domain-containing protein n=1 Tax=Luteibacter sahnii TaxID=3021977 RepID=A0ABT6B7Q3_9GAMM
MTAGALICLGLIGLLLGAQIGCVLQACFRKPKGSCCPAMFTHARRDYLDRKAEVERDARRRL